MRDSPESLRVAPIGRLLANREARLNPAATPLLTSNPYSNYIYKGE